MIRGNYQAWSYSSLDAITRDNVQDLELAWTWSMREGGWNAPSPIVHDGVIYVTNYGNLVQALDGRTGDLIWEHEVGIEAQSYSGMSRNLAVYEDKVFLATSDARMVALDAATGEMLWTMRFGDNTQGHQSTSGPIVVRGKIVQGLNGCERFSPVGCYISGIDADTGELLWTFHTVARADEPGGDTWPFTGVRERGGGGTWATGSYDPELNLIYWGVGNPNPDYYGDLRPGDNLYSNSIVALDADTGELRWHYQFTPHDLNDWDSNQIPVLADIEWQGSPRRVVMLANRNGFFYVMDRVNGELLLATPFTATTWAREIGADGRPIVLNDGSKGCLPDPWGSTNFMPPSYYPELGLFYLTARETCATYVAEEPTFVPGQSSFGGVVFIDGDQGSGALRALDVQTGDLRWEFPYPSPTFGGVLTTAASLVFAGDHEGNFMAFDAVSGENLWHYQTGSRIWGAAAMTHMLDGRQYVLIASGTTLTAFALPGQ